MDSVLSSRKCDIRSKKISSRRLRHFFDGKNSFKFVFTASSLRLPGLLAFYRSRIFFFLEYLFYSSRCFIESYQKGNLRGLASVFGLSRAARVNKRKKMGTRRMSLFLLRTPLAPHLLRGLHCLVAEKKKLPFFQARKVRVHKVWGGLEFKKLENKLEKILLFFFGN